MRSGLDKIRELDQTFSAQKHYMRNGIWIENSEALFRNTELRQNYIVG